MVRRRRRRRRRAAAAVHVPQGAGVVFGSRFVHSTEPGAAKDGEMHGYLCFTFGTDEAAAWPQIAKTIDTQSRILLRPDGALRLSRLGEGIERAVEEMAAARLKDE